MKHYDYLIIGAGLFGAVFAHEAHKRGKRCIVIEKRNHIGGNVFTKSVEGINVHQYGPHIFHTNDRKIWEYVNKFVSFNHYRHTAMANFKGEMYNLPFNMNTYYALWKTATPQEAFLKIESQRKAKVDECMNLEDHALSQVGTDLYNKLIKEYTEKQWGRKAKDLPAFIIKRLPVRFTYNNDYFSDQYQGIPVGGYTRLIERLLDGIEVRTGIDFFDDRDSLSLLAHKIVFTGMIDQFFNYRFGTLEYRSLRFEHETIGRSNFQGHSVVNYTDSETPFTRIIEHKHFEFGQQAHTIITREYPENWDSKKEPYYPVNDLNNMRLYGRYNALSSQYPNVIFGGRLAEYRYYDMHQIVGSALTICKRELQ